MLIDEGKRRDRSAEVLMLAQSVAAAFGDKGTWSEWQEKLIDNS